jgi:hypothetical protein
MSEDELRTLIQELGARVAGLEQRVGCALDVVATLHPAAMLLTSYGIDEAGRRRIDHVVDTMSARIDSGIPVAYVEFEARIAELIPGEAGDRRFFELLIEALKLERPHSKRLFEQFSKAMALLRS